LILFAFVALALIMPTLIHGIQQNNQEIIGTVTARQLHQVTQGAQGYITPLQAAQCSGRPIYFTLSYHWKSRRPGKYIW